MHACFVPCVYFHGIHACTSTHVLPCVCFHETCTLHTMSKCGPRKHVTKMQCSILVVPRVITRVKMKLLLSSTVYVILHTVYTEIFEFTYFTVNLLSTEFLIPKRKKETMYSQQKLNCENPFRLVFHQI